MKHAKAMFGERNTGLGSQRATRECDTESGSENRKSTEIQCRTEEHRRNRPGSCTPQGQDDRRAAEKRNPEHCVDSESQVDVDRLKPLYLLLTNQLQRGGVTLERH